MIAREMLVEARGMVQGVQVSAPLGKFAAAVDVIEALGQRSGELELQASKLVHIRQGAGSRATGFIRNPHNRRTAGGCGPRQADVEQKARLEATFGENGMLAWMVVSSMRG